MIINVNEYSKETSLKDARETVVFHNGEAFKYFDEGCTRYVYVNENRTKVVKLLKGIGDWNEEEFSIYENAKTDEVKEMAETKLINGLIVQEYVEPIKFAGKKLTMPQIRFAQSCRNEVGWTKEGDLVCFDLDEYKKY